MVQTNLKTKTEKSRNILKNITVGQLFHLNKKTRKYVGGRFFTHEQNKKRKVLNPRKGTEEGTAEGS